MPSPLLTELPAVAFDLETTGIDVFSDLPVSYAFAGWGATETFTHTSLLHPGRPIPASASAIHGITDEMVCDAPSLSEGMEDIARRLTQVWDTGAVLVGMNVSYDLTIVDVVARTLGLSSPLDRDVAPVIDVLVVDRHFDRYRKGKRRLVELCEFYGVVLDDAHQAAGDARATLAVHHAQLERYVPWGQTSLDTATSDVKTWYRQWLENFSEYLIGQGKAPISRGRFEWPIHEHDET